MATPAHQPATSRQGLLPQIKGLDNRFWIVNIMEMFERLAYYGVRAVVAIYMVLPLEQGGPQFTHVEKGSIFAAWASVQSVLPVFTGGFADRYGHKRTIAVAIVLKMIGYLLMGTQMSYGGFFAGCIMLAAGTAIFKPGVQGTLAATLRDSNASVGWALFYQLVNIGGFLGPVLAGVLRNEFSWSWVFYSCAIIVAVNFLWLPFYRDPTETEPAEESSADDEASTAAALGQLSASVSRSTAAFWLFISAAALVYSIWHWWSVAMQGEVLIEWMYTMWAALFVTAFALYLPRKDALDAGRADVMSVFIVSVVGLFQHRVLWFCILFAGFWLMFNQVFDLLPNVIEDWVDTSGIIATLGGAFSGPVTPAVLALFAGLIFGGLCALGILLAMRPDRRDVEAVPTPAYAVVAIALAGAALFPVRLVVPADLSPLILVGIIATLGVAGAVAAKLSRVPAVPLAAGAALAAGLAAVVVIRADLMASAAGLVALAAEGGQVNPEWMINLNPALIVFTMVGFGYLTSFVRPLTSILIGMFIATVGSYTAGTATIGLSCLAGIAIFSVGEMLSSPKKMEFLASLARKGQEGTFMGYANMPVAIGWILGSIGAGSWYEQHGDKKNLAREHLINELGMSREVVEALPRSELVPMLADKLSMTPIELQGFLFETYHPERIWLIIAMIGGGSIVGMLLYAGVLRYIDAREPQR